MILSLLILLPIVGAVALLVIPRRQEDVVKIVAFAISVLALLVSLPLYFGFDNSVTGYQFEEQYNWIPAFNLSYHVGIDGLSLFLVILTTFLTAISIKSSMPSDISLIATPT